MDKTEGAAKNIMRIENEYRPFKETLDAASAAERPREIELKIVNLGDPQTLAERIADLGGGIVRDRRPLQDMDFTLNQGRTHTNQEFEIALKDFPDPQRLRDALEFLGLEVVVENKDRLRIRSKKIIPRRKARIRQDGKDISWTIKERRVKGLGIDDRVEIEVPLTDPQPALAILENTGYSLKSRAEKYRTTYQIGETLVELNEGPKAPPWVEIEGKTAADVFKTLQDLGYSQSDTAAISDAEYYRRHGVSDEELKDLKFENP